MNGLQTTAFVFMIIATVCVGWCLIPLIWCIPMCVHYYREHDTCSTSFKVCTLIFVSLIGGILMLCDNK